jgi:hypothetical protein
MDGEAKAEIAFTVNSFLLRNLPPVELRRPEIFPSFNCIALVSDTLYRTNSDQIYSPGPSTKWLVSSLTLNLMAVQESEYYTCFFMKT